MVRSVHVVWLDLHQICVLSIIFHKVRSNHNEEVQMKVTWWSAMLVVLLSPPPLPWCCFSPSPWGGAAFHPYAFFFFICFLFLPLPLLLFLFLFFSLFGSCQEYPLRAPKCSLIFSTSFHFFLLSCFCLCFLFPSFCFVSNFPCFIFQFTTLFIMFHLFVQFVHLFIF